MGAIAVVGPTAASKSALAMRLADALGGEIVSVDSMQVYRGLDIGSAKPSIADRVAVPHHMIDVAEPEEAFTVAQFQELGVVAVDDIERRRAIPVIVGGSGLHFRALVDPLEFPPTEEGARRAIEAQGPAESVLELLEADPEAAATVDLANPRRVARALEIFRITGETPSSRAATVTAAAVRGYEPRLPLLAFGMDPGDGLADRVVHRFDTMLAAGLLEEVDSMKDRLGITASQGVGYKELLPVVRGATTLEVGRDAAIRSTMGLAKRQRTFFGRDPRIRWIPWHDGFDRAVEYALTVAKETIRETTWTL
jgi:tRNA dimethylallyltransferase